MIGIISSGLVGAWQRDERPLDRDRIAAMAGRMAHRGAARLATNTAGAAFGVLAPTGSEAAIAQRNGRIAAIAARIDNLSDLAAELDAPADATPADIVLRAYERWGESCPEHLFGDFVVAIWSSLERQLFCARDRLGTRPFYYHLAPERFVFASEDRPLLDAADVPRDLEQRQDRGLPRPGIRRPRPHVLRARSTAATRPFPDRRGERGVPAPLLGARPGSPRRAGQ